ncbi:uncharacterized protein LTR77_007644 [Saxophila tyrrhenica]|uniref:Major facilitator superfamily (MFS) profile domain-containing protein n=1 Tax=Saxophila tyrrhenica TaxID=1690608 RepID=A0AAV9P5G3_9PEZI|nr:hypothetical protein LTR77_007644 [Saxophila tyrrhenica]
MSYKQLHDAANGVDAGEHLDHAVDQSQQSPFKVARSERRFFKTAHSLHTAISVAAGTVMMLFGYEQGVFGGIIVGEDFLEYFNQPSPAMQGFVTSVYGVGEKLGRKKMLIISTIVMTIGIILQTAAHSMNDMVLGRFVAGIGNGGNTATAPVWHVETSHQSAKGSAVVKEMAVNVLGFVLSNFITLAFSGVVTEAQWRFPLGIQLIFCLIILSMIPILPESPRWSIARGKEEAARLVLHQLNDGDAEVEFEEIRSSVKAEQATKGSWSQLLRGGIATRRVLLGMMLQVAQQLSGINVLAYYLPVVLHRSVGLPQLTARLVAAANAVSFWLATSASILFVEKVGRRPLLMLTAGIMAIAFLGVSIGVGVGQVSPDSHAPGIVATVFIWLYFTTFASGWISIPWLYPAEVVVQTTPPGIHHLKWGLYLIYAILNATFVPLVYYLVVETRGRSLESTDRWFAANPKWLVHGADHSVATGTDGAQDARYGGLSVAEDHEAMMRDFEVGSDDEMSSPGSPVVRRASYPTEE